MLLLFLQFRRGLPDTEYVSSVTGLLSVQSHTQGHLTLFVCVLFVFCLGLMAHQHKY